MLVAGLPVGDVVRADVAEAATSATHARAPIGHTNVPLLAAPIGEPHAGGNANH